MAGTRITPQPAERENHATTGTADSTTSDNDAAVPTGSADDSPAVAAAAPIVDVWSRTEQKYRIRAYALLATNLLLFCGLCAFSRWLHVARTFDFAPSSYYQPFRFWDAAAPSLNDFILAPINVVDVPLHAAVLGLVMAVMVAVPIVVSILYRFRFALPFLAAVLVFAHMPWMAITLLGSCVLASLRPFRMPFRFGSALLALLPVVLYLYLATRGGVDPLANYGSPTQKMILIAPWVLAILGAAMGLGVVLLIARLVNYRPGAVAPVLAVMFAFPVGLFHVGVGADELAYRVLESEYGPRSRRFEPVLKSQETQDEIWALIYKAIGGSTVRGRLRSELLGLWSLEPEKFRELKRSVSRKFLAKFLSDRAEAKLACERFIADHPQSRYVPNVLYIEGRVLDTRLDEAKLAQVEPLRELYTEFPHAESEETWLRLLKQYPDSPFAVQAGLRLAQLQLRAGKIDEASRNLRLVLGKHQPDSGTRPTTQPSNRSVLAPAPPESSLDFQPEPYRLEALRLTELIDSNRDDPNFGNKPLVALAELDSRRSRYREQLLRLAAKYRESKLYDNLVVLWANALSDSDERASTLEACTRTFTAGDALPEALYRLAILETQSIAPEHAAQRAAGVARLRDIIARFRDTYWSDRAAERLSVLEPRGTTAEEYQ